MDRANLPFGTFSLRGAFHTAHTRNEKTEKTHLLSCSAVLRTVMYFKVVERLKGFRWYHNDLHSFKRWCHRDNTRSLILHTKTAKLSLDFVQKFPVDDGMLSII